VIDEEYGEKDQMRRPDGGATNRTGGSGR